MSNIAIAQIHQLDAGDTHFRKYYRQFYGLKNHHEQKAEAARDAAFEAGGWWEDPERAGNADDEAEGEAMEQEGGGGDDPMGQAEEEEEGAPLQVQAERIGDVQPMEQEGQAGPSGVGPPRRDGGRRRDPSRLTNASGGRPDEDSEVSDSMSDDDDDFRRDMRFVGNGE